MVDSGSKSKNEQSVINSWSRCDIDTCDLSLRLIIYSRTACVSVGTPLFYKIVYDEFCEKLICTHENIMNCRYV
jgi:hypothetical protein